jgi:hypothetical protein
MSSSPAVAIVDACLHARLGSSAAVRIGPERDDLAVAKAIVSPATSDRARRSSAVALTGCC